MTHILVTGSRHWQDANRIRLALDWVTEHYNGPYTLIEGEAQGADTLARIEAQAREWRIIAVPAQWDKCASDCPPYDHRRIRADGKVYCPRAGLRRNRRMIALMLKSRDEMVCIAFPSDAVRSGTLHCMSEAKRQGITVMNFGKRKRSVT